MQWREFFRLFRETLGWEVGDWWTPTPDGKLLRCLKIWARHAGEFPGFRATSCERTFAPGLGLPGRIWSSQKPAWISDITKDNNFPRASVAIREGLHAAFAFPISFRKRIPSR